MHFGSINAKPAYFTKAWSRGAANVENRVDAGEIEKLLKKKTVLEIRDFPTAKWINYRKKLKKGPQ